MSLLLLFYRQKISACAADCAIYKNCSKCCRTQIYNRSQVKMSTGIITSAINMLEHTEDNKKNAIVQSEKKNNCSDINKNRNRDEKNEPIIKVKSAIPRRRWVCYLLFI